MRPRLTEEKVLKPVDLYTVTTIGGSSMGKKKYHDRTPAVCTSLERAREILEKNEGDLYECGYYPLAVIELKPSDLVYPQIQDTKRCTQWWFRFNTRRQTYVPCRRPKQFRQVIGFGVG